MSSGQDMPIAYLYRSHSTSIGSRPKCTASSPIFKDLRGMGSRA